MSEKISLDSSGINYIIPSVANVLNYSSIPHE